MKNRVSYLAAVLFVLLAGYAIAQENEGTPPTQSGPFRINGTVSVGLRADQVSGLENTTDYWADRLFHEQFQIDPSKGGLPIFDLNLFGEKPGVGRIGTEMYLNASYNGANFLGSFRLREFGMYDFKFSYKHSPYFFDRFDSIYSDLRQFDQGRDRYTASLTVMPVKDLDINVTYDGNGRSGFQEIPRSPALEYGGEFLNNQTGGYARGNIFLQHTPLNDWTHDIKGSITARLPMTSVTAGGGYRKFAQEVEETPVSLTSLNDRGDSVFGYINEFGIVGASTSVKAPLKTFKYQEDRESKGPFAFGQIVFNPIDMLSAVVDVNYQSIDGEATLDAFQSGLIWISSKETRDYRSAFFGSSEESVKKLNAAIGLSFRPIPGLSVNGGFKMQTRKQTTLSEYHTTLDTCVKGTETTKRTFVSVLKDSLHAFGTSADYDTPLNTILGDVAYSPLTNLSLRAGIRLDMRTPKVVRSNEGVIDTGFSNDLSKKSTFTTITGNIYYRPIKEVAVRARVENKSGKVEWNNYLGTVPATTPDLTPRITPLKDLAISGSIDADPIEGLTISVGGKTHSGTTALTPLATVTTSVTPWELEQKGNAFTGAISYQLPMNSQISVSGSFEKNDFSIPATWSRGSKVVNNPFGTSLDDSMSVIVAQNTKDLFFTVDASTQPVSGLTVGVGFDYVRSTGGSSMNSGLVAKPAVGTVPVAGDYERLGAPLTRWQGRARVEFDVLSNLGVTVDALLVNQKEDKTSDVSNYFAALNNYKASLLTFGVVFKL
jgi:hypothetical protein